ncbi:hypothetical protein [Streptomyces sp. NPDC001880]
MPDNPLCSCTEFTLLRIPTLPKQRSHATFPGQRPCPLPRRPLLIVDEPTSALDPKTEIEAFRALRSLADQGTTVLLITHRLAATVTADLIHVLGHGRLIERGSHASLITIQHGHYRALYETQAAQYATEASA